MRAVVLFCLGLMLLAPVDVWAQVPSATSPLRERVALGTYVPGVPYFARGERDLSALERKIGAKFDIVSGFVDWDYVFGEPRDLALSAAGTRTLLYSWEPHCTSAEACIGFAQVASGAQDAYLRRIAQSMRRFPHVIYVRPWGEMNAHWSPWQPGSDQPRAGSPAEFVQAWRHLRDFFRREGIDNLKFVFNPDASDDETHTRIADIWPGEDYVDVLGIDGYNWGINSSGEGWEEFEDIFAPMYQLLTDLHPTAPVWICEVGSKEPEKSDGTYERPALRDPHHSKGAWHERMLSSRAFLRVQALVTFHVQRGRDFRLDSSLDSLKAIRRQLRLRTRARLAARLGP